MELDDLPTYMVDMTWPGLLSFVLAAILPLIVAAVARASWSGTAKGLLLLLLSAVKAVIEAVMTHAYGGVSAVVMMVAMNFLVAVGVHFGLLRGSAVQARLLALGSRTPPRY